jgi:hypothetical protein
MRNRYLFSPSQVLVGNAFPDALRRALSFAMNLTSYFTLRTRSVWAVRDEVELRHALINFCGISVRKLWQATS